MQLWKNFKITCPICRTVKKIYSPNDIPCTNHNLIKLYKLTKDKHKIKDMSEKYLETDYALSKLADIKESIDDLKLIKISGSQLIYAKKAEPMIKQKCVSIPIISAYYFWFFIYLSKVKTIIIKPSRSIPKALFHISTLSFL